MAGQVTVSVRMYKMKELGDCFLLHFQEGDRNSHVLIDCGSFRNSEKSKTHIKAVVDNIREELQGKKLDVVVGTHQHNDHMSGFAHCKEDFSKMVEQVWLSWLDDPKDPFARRIQRDQKGLVDQLQKIHLKMQALKLDTDRGAVKDVLDFFGVDGDAPRVPAEGVQALKTMGEKEPEYLSPGEILDLPGLDPGSVKVYVLGPPRRRESLFDKDPSKDETYDPHLALAESSASKILSALESQASLTANRDEEQFPFNSIFKKKPADADKDIVKLYNRKEDEYRKIDKEWLEGADRLALYLDSYTNNSSLVLAFELVRTGKVLLFAADAQTGNWSSWENIGWGEDKKDFKTYSLLRNTVLYKVGHHGSHNATLVNALEAMEHPELVAMIPVDRTDANIMKKNGWKMPAKNLYKRLKEKTKYRILVMDNGYADDCDPAKNDQSGWKDVGKVDVSESKMYIEYIVKG
jgi:glyoxylase-like metal-dependent hydrolase (beta-lactamase superfamily II)